MASSVLEHLRSKFHGDESIGVVGLFCEVYTNAKTNASRLCKSIRQQLIRNNPAMPLLPGYDEDQVLSVEDIRTQISSAATSLSRMFFVVDGLDLLEGHTEIFRLLQPEINFIFTSRNIPTVIRTFETSHVMELRAMDADISKYLRASLETAVAGTNDPETLANSVQLGTAFADGLKIMSRARQSDSAITLIAWMANYDHTLRKPQMEDLIKFVHGDIVSDETRSLDIDSVISACAGLVLESSVGSLVLSHHTAKLYFSKTQDEWFPNAESDAEWEDRLMQHRFYMPAATTWGLYARKALDKQKDSEDESMKIRTLDAIMGFLERGAQVKAAVQALKMDYTATQSSGSATQSSGWSQTYPQEWTGIHLVAYFGLTEVMEKMLPADGVVWNPNLDDAYSPIIVAAERGQHSTLNFMLGKLNDGTGGQQMQINGMASHLALLGAAQNGHESCVRLLLTDGVSPNGPAGSMAPLSCAVEDGHANVVKTLLEFGADPNMQRDTESPLMLAINNGHVKIVSLLMDNGAVLGKEESQFSAAPSTERILPPGIEPLLLREGAGINDRNEDGFTALHISAISGHAEAVRLLLENGADAHSADNAGVIPLEYAIQGGYDEVVNLLLDYDWNHQD
ncbi:ankyrin repeat protein [Colletotrichum camelliae]|nr:ankyrin repeat protein [Colletotrichum camelliae]